jgi:hypothetical protein
VIGTVIPPGRVVIAAEGAGAVVINTVVEATAPLAVAGITMADAGATSEARDWMETTSDWG